MCVNMSRLVVSEGPHVARLLPLGFIEHMDLGNSLNRMIADAVLNQKRRKPSNIA